MMFPALILLLSFGYAMSAVKALAGAVALLYASFAIQYTCTFSHSHIFTFPHSALL
jgi:hypothetical protein